MILWIALAIVVSMHVWLGEDEPALGSRSVARNGASQVLAVVPCLRPHQRVDAHQAACDEPLVTARRRRGASEHEGKVLA